jgi:hypothetical protein
MTNAACRLLASTFAALAMAAAHAQAVHRLVIDVADIAPPDAAGRRSASVLVRAVDGAGLVVPEATFTTALRAYGHPSAGVVVSEVALDGTEFELTNAGSDPVDLEGWILAAGQGRYEARGTAVHVIQGPAVLAPGEVAVWSSRTDAGGAFPLIRHPQPFPLPRSSDIEIRDSAGRLVDQLLLAELESGRERRWAGPPVSLAGLTGGTIRRVGSANRFAAQDWVAGTNTVGSPNPGLRLPWVGARTAAIVAPVTITLTNGLWRGEVAVSGEANRPWTLGAFSPDNLLWESGPIPVPPAPALSLRLVEGALSASEAAPGRTALAQVGLPPGTTLGEALVVALRFDAAGEFDAPATVLIPAGSTSAEFAIRNLDDDLADGRARVRLTASAAGYAVASWMLTQDDNEAGRLFVQLPGQAGEGVGLLTRTGSVSLAAPAQHDTEVTLASSGRLWAPATVVIAQGAVSAAFPVRVLDDPRFNLPPVRDTVAASMPGWPTAVASLRVEDGQFPDFRIELPQSVLEGKSAAGALVFNAAPDRPLTVRLSVRGTAVRIPAELVVPAGTNRVAFSIEAPDDAVPYSGESPLICAETDHFTAECKGTEMHDDDHRIDALSVVVPAVAFGPGPVPITITLRDATGRPKRVSGTVQVRVSKTFGNVRVAAASGSLPLVNGEFAGTVTLEGSGDATVLEVTLGEFTGTSNPLSLVTGRAPALNVADIAAWPGHTNLLALLIETPVSGWVGRLAELDPATGSIVRELPLPSPAHRLAVSDSGTVAWLASLSNTVQRIRLDDWTHAGEVALGTTNAPRHGLLVSVSPGTTDDFVALTTPTRVSAAQPYNLVGFRNAGRLGQVLDLGTQPYGPGLIPGRTPAEFYVTLSKHTYRVRLTDSGLETAVHRNLLDVPSGYVSQAALVGTNLVFAGGLVVDAETLADAGEYPSSGTPPLRTAVLPLPDLGLVLFAVENGRLRSYDLGTRAEARTLVLPGDGNTAPFDRLVRWGRRGAAMVSWSRRELRIVDEAGLSTPLADLGISLELPARVRWPASSPRPGSIPVMIVLTNRGPEVALNLRTEIGHGDFAFHDFLLPGGSIVLRRELEPALVGPAVVTAGVTAETADPDRGNNSATATTVVEPLEGPGQAIVPLHARHLVARPDGSELWVATGPESGFEGVVGLEPTTGQRVRAVEVGPNPRRLAPMADNRGFYVQLGANRIVRWNLDANGIDFDRTFAGGAVLDFVSLPGPGERLAVLQAVRLLVLEGTNQIQALALTTSTNRALAIGGGQLWTARDNELRVYNQTAGGLALVRTVPIFQANGDYRFTTDGQWAGFGDHVFDPASGLRVYTESGSAPLIPWPDGTFFGVAGNRLRRLTLPNLLPAGDAVVPALSRAGAVLDQVRWGADGFAFRTESGLIVSLRSTAVPTGQADLAVTIEPVGTPHYLYPSEFRVVVTNRGPDSVQRFEVSAVSQRAASLSATVPAVVGGDSIRIPVGELAAGQAREVRFSAVPTDSAIGFNVGVTGSALDPHPEDNRLQVEFPTRAIPANLGLHIELPAAPPVGSEFDAFCVVTNAGPAAITNPALYFRGFRLLRWLGTDKGRFDVNSVGEGLLQDFIPTLEPESSVRIRLRLRADRPGFYGLRASLNLFVDDPDRRDNWIRAVLHIPESGGSTAFPRLAVDFVRGQWSPARNQWIVGDEFGLTYLHAETLLPVGGLTFPFEASEYLQNQEGTHVWLGTDSGYDRFDLATGLVDLRIAPDQNSARYNATAATLPGRPDALVLFGLTVDSKLEVSVVANGRRLPDTYDADLTWQGRRLVAVGGPDNRVFVSNGGQMRELEVTPTGLRFVRNLDAYQRHTDVPMAVSGGLLVQGLEEALDLASLTWVPVGSLVRPVYDALSFRQGVLPDGSSRTEAFDLLQRQPVWAVPGHWPNSSLIGAGSRGALALGPDGGLIAPPSPRSVDLRLDTLGTPTIAGAGREFPVTLRLRQSDTWLAGRARIQAELPVGVELVEPAVAGTSPGFTVPFTLPSTNLTVRLRAATPGPIHLSFRASSDLEDPTPEDARVDLDLTVPPAPAVLLSDLTVNETGEPFMLRLSHPAPETLSVTLRAEPITTEADDLLSPTLEVTFAAGRSETEVYWIQGDSIVEEDEQFRLSVAPGSLAASAASVTVTLRNDDRANLRTTAETRPEGNAGAVPALVQVWVDGELETPVELGFATVSGTALAGEDFLPLTGRLVFSSQQRTNRISVAIVGDTAYEPAETFGFDWLEPQGALLPRTATTVTLQNDDPVPAPVATLSLAPDGRFAVQFLGLPGVRYSLQSREFAAGGTWRAEGGTVTGAGGILTLRPAARTNDTWFYRLQAN